MHAIHALTHKNTCPVRTTTPSLPILPCSIYWTKRFHTYVSVPATSQLVLTIVPFYGGDAIEAMSPPKAWGKRNKWWGVGLTRCSCMHGHAGDILGHTLDCMQMG